MIEFEFEYLDYLNNTEYEYDQFRIWIQKNIQKQKYIKTIEQRKLHTVFCTLIKTETLKFRIWVIFILIIILFQTSTEYEFE